MPVEFDVKYLRSKKKVAKKIALENIEQTEKLFLEDPTYAKLQLKSIQCRKDKHKQSIRVLGKKFY